MPNTVRPHHIEDELAVRLPKHQILSTGVTQEMAKLYTSFATLATDKATFHAKEATQLLEKSHFVNELLDDLNNITQHKEKIVIDFSYNQALQAKIEKARALGVNIPEKTQFDSEEARLLISNITRKGQRLSESYQPVFQKAQEWSQKLNMFLMLVKECQKAENSPKRAAIAGVR